MAKCETCGKPVHDGCCEGCIVSHEYEEKRSTCLIGPAWLKEPAPFTMEDLAAWSRQSQRRRKKQ